jgi:hypothetical protein
MPPDWFPTNTRPYVALIGELIESEDSDDLVVLSGPSGLSYVAETGTESMLKLLDITIDLAWLTKFLEQSGVSNVQSTLDLAADQRRIVVLGRSREENLASLTGIGFFFNKEAASLESFETYPSLEPDDTDSVIFGQEIAELLLTWDTELDIPSMIVKFAEVNTLSSDFIADEFFKILPTLLVTDCATLYVTEGTRR